MTGHSARIAWQRMRSDMTRALLPAAAVTTGMILSLSSLVVPPQQSTQPDDAEQHAPPGENIADFRVAFQVQDDRSRGSAGGRDKREHDPDSDGRRFRDRASQARSVDSEWRSNLIAVVMDLYPERASAAQLERLAEERPQEFRALFHENGRTIMMLARLREREPEIYRVRVAHFHLSRQAEELASRVRDARRADSPEAKDLRKALMQILNRQLASEITSNELEIQSLQQRIEFMQHRIDEQRTTRESIVSQRMTRLLNENGSSYDPN